MKMVIKYPGYRETDLIEDIDTAEDREKSRRSHRLSRKTKRKYTRSRDRSSANAFLGQDGTKFCKKVYSRSRRAQYLRGIDDDTYATRCRGNVGFSLASVVYERT